jgi:Calcineurin-like phosphoesterase
MDLTGDQCAPHASSSLLFNALTDSSISMYFRYLVVLLISLYGQFHLLQLISAKQTPEKAVENTKHFSEIIQVAILPENLKPSKIYEQGGRRLIFIGDVHGTYNELELLLKKMNYTSSKGIKMPKQTLTLDHVVFLGDMVSKGPHSLRVVKLAMKLNASCVIGNHDYQLLDRIGYIRSMGNSRLDQFVHQGDLVLSKEEHLIATEFDSQAAGWLLQCPLILKVGQVNGEELVAVHAGLLPGKSLQEQGQFKVNHC